MIIWISRVLSLFNFKHLHSSWALIIHSSQKLWRLNLPRAFVFIFEHLDILWAWIGHPSKKLWPFEFLESCRCSFSSISIYHGRHTCIRVKIYGYLNLPRASLLNFKRLNTHKLKEIKMGLNDAPESKFMVVWICRELHCSISSVSIYYAPESYIQMKSYDHLHFSSASVV